MIFLKIDTHVHSNGISKCSRVTYQEIIDRKIAGGYGGAVLMNHCQHWYYEPENLDSWKEEFILEYERAYEYAKQKNFKLMFGIEVSVSEPRWADFLIFGVTKEFIRLAPDLCRISQKELFEYCENFGALLVQAHPFRLRHEPMDSAYMHGLEINTQPTDLHNKNLVIKQANENGLFIIAGTDYHDNTADNRSGIIVPDDIENSVDLAKYLKKTTYTEVFIHDIVQKFDKKIIK